MSLIDVDCPKDIFLQLISWTPHALVSPTFKEKKKQTENTFQKKKKTFYTRRIILAYMYVRLLKERPDTLTCLTVFSLFLIKTNRFHVAVCLFSDRSQKASKSGENISDTLGYEPAMALYASLYCSYHTLTSSIIYYWTDVREHGIYSNDSNR